MTIYELSQRIPVEALSETYELDPAKVYVCFVDPRVVNHDSLLKVSDIWPEDGPDFMFVYYHPGAMQDAQEQVEKFAKDVMDRKGEAEGKSTPV